MEQATGFAVKIENSRDQNIQEIDPRNTAKEMGHWEWQKKHLLMISDQPELMYACALLLSDRISL